MKTRTEIKHEKYKTKSGSYIDGVLVEEINWKTPETTEEAIELRRRPPAAETVKTWLIDIIEYCDCVIFKPNPDNHPEIDGLARAASHYAASAIEQIRDGNTDRALLNAMRAVSNQEQIEKYALDNLAALGLRQRKAPEKNRKADHNEVREFIKNLEESEPGKNKSYYDQLAADEYSIDRSTANKIRNNKV